MHNVNLTTTT